MDKRFVEKYKCGLYYDPKDKKSFDLIFEQIKTDRKNLEIMGRNSRKLSVSLFDRELLTEQISTLI